MSQHLEALERANEVRMENARLRRQLRAGEVDPADAVLTCTHAMPVRRFLTAIPRVGTVKAEKMMREAGIDSWRRFCSTSQGGEADYDKGITMEQRRRLHAILLTRLSERQAA